MLRFVLGLALTMSKQFGCVGVLVDAKPAAVGFYERFDFVRVTVCGDQFQPRPRIDSLFLAISRIKSALGMGQDPRA